MAMRHLRDTISSCPRCLEKVSARIFERDGKVFLRKECIEHGPEEVLVANDAAFHWSDAGAAEACGSHGCALARGRTLVFEITERCNLECHACFAESSPHRAWSMDLAEFESKLDRFLGAGVHDSDVVQISGGEPTIHPQVDAMIRACFARGVRRVCVHTNGLRLAADPDFARHLAGTMDHGGDLRLYLQLNGFHDATSTLLRGKRGLGDLKRRAIAHAVEAGLRVVPVMTVARGVNIHEIGAVVRLALDAHPRMNTVILQPAFYSGRYECDPSPKRVTARELAAEVERQTGLFARDDFGPIPGSHPSCFALAVGLVRAGQVVPVSRYFPQFGTRRKGAARAAAEAEGMLGGLTAAFSGDSAIDELLDALGSAGERVDWSCHEHFFFVAIESYMDAHTYDQGRVDRCRVHVVARSGQAVSFCEYNALRRPKGLP